MATIYVLIALVFAAGIVAGMFWLKRSSGAPVALGATGGCVLATSLFFFLAGMWWMGVVACAAVVACGLWASSGDQNTWGRPIAGWAGILMLGLAFAHMADTWTGGDKAKLVANAERNADVLPKAKGFVIGKYLAENLAGSKVVFVHSAFPSTGPEILAGVKLGAGDSVTISEVRLHETVASQMDPDEAAYAAWDYNVLSPGDVKAIVSRNPGCQVIISALGLPVETQPDDDSLTVGAPPSRPVLGDDLKWILTAGNANLKLRHFTSGKVLVVVATDPKKLRQFNPTVPLPSDLAEASAKVNVFITKDNADEVSQRYPMLVSP